MYRMLPESLLLLDVIGGITMVDNVLLPLGLESSRQFEVDHAHVSHHSVSSASIILIRYRHYLLKSSLFSLCHFLSNRQVCV